MTALHQNSRYRRASPKSRLVPIDFEPSARKKYVFRVSRTFRAIGIFLNICMGANIIAVAIQNQSLKEQRAWNIPHWAVVSNDLVTASIATGLIVTLIFLLLTVKKYVKGSQKAELKTTRIRSFFVLFNLAYIYLAAL